MAVHPGARPLVPHEALPPWANFQNAAICSGGGVTVLFGGAQIRGDPKKWGRGVYAALSRDGARFSRGSVVLDLHDVERALSSRQDSHRNSTDVARI